MWKSTVISIMILISPFLICDPDTNVKSYILTDNGKLIGQVEAQKDGSLKYDIRKIKVGLHRVSVIPCNEYWCDEIETFTFVRPKQLKETIQIKLIPSLDTQDSQYVVDKKTSMKFLNPPPKKGR